MPIRVNLPDGGVANFPDGTPPAEIEQALASYGKPAAALPADATRGMMRPDNVTDKPKTPGILSRAGAAVDQVLKMGPTNGGVTDPKTGKPIQVLGTEAIPAWAQPTSTGGSAALEAIAAFNPAEAMATAGQAIRKAPGIIARAVPSRARAGASIDAAVTAAKDVPVVGDKLNSALDEIMQYDRIERIPMAVRELVTEMKKSKRGPFDVEVARRFYPAISRGSVAEWNNLTPNMQRLVGGLRATLDDAITGAADTVGAGEQYASGMKEFARASKWSRRADEVKPVAKKLLGKAAGGAATAAGAGTVWRALFGGGD